MSAPALPVRLLLAAGFLLACALASAATGDAPGFDLLIRGGTVYDGTGGAGRRADIGVRGDRIVAIGDLATQPAQRVIDAKGLAVAPGFINMLSWAVDSLMVDGRAQSDIRQGVTLEVFGEGDSMGPLGERLRADMLAQQGDIKYPIEWRGFGEYLEYMEKKGTAPNLASFIGATTVRINVLGYEDRRATTAELEQMQAMVRTAMEEGALGIGSSLIYAPAFYADTEELIALNKAAAPYGGRYISHMRSEGNRLVEAVDELIRIAREAGVGAEIYHLKAAGRANWGKLDTVLARVESARKAGLDITADMYTYTAGATGLDAAMPPWVQEGGHDAWVARLKDPAVRERVAKEMRTPTDSWENLLLGAGPEGTLLSGFKNDALKPLTGKTLAEVARTRGKTPEETAIELVIEDDSRVGTIYFLMSEDNVRRQIKQPWVAFGSDASADTTEGVFLKSNPHPRTYGNVARLLGRYVREEKLIPLEEAVRRLTTLPATNLKLRERGKLAEGFYADIVVFDPATVADHATFEKPHQYSTGVRDVFVNGVAVLSDGEPTGATPGRAVRGPGWKGWR
jgi:N-acyl-D-amino-acid deacylase